jgi:hypothetical protein
VISEADKTESNCPDDTSAGGVVKAGFFQKLSMLIEHKRLQGIAHIATVAGVAFGAYQLMLSAHESRDAARLQHEIAANQSWERYMALSLEHPDFVNGAKFESLKPEERASYIFYVQYLLFASEQVLEYSKNDREWNFSIVYEARRHLPYLSSKKFLDAEVCSYSEDLKSLLSENIPSMRRGIAACPAKLDNIPSPPSSDEVVGNNA